MDIIQETKDVNKKTFLSHVFSTTEEGKAEILNVVQYALIGVIPIVLLNKFINRFIPEADPEKSTVELTVEILIQLIVMFVGIVIIHRVITYMPTYSGFKYDNLVLTNVILAFLIIVLSIQTKLGIKTNILVDRFNELWNGPSNAKDNKAAVKSSVKVSQPMAQHSPSQADYLDGPQSGMFPPAPMATSKPQTSSGYDYMMKGGSSQPHFEAPVLAANSLLGSNFGSF